MEKPTFENDLKGLGNLDLESPMNEDLGTFEPHMNEDLENFEFDPENELEEHWEEPL